MSKHPPLPSDPFALTALLLATDPIGLGGAVLTGPGGPANDEWVARLRSLFPDTAPWRRIPSVITADRLVGGVDLGSTLAQGRRILMPGILAETHGGVVILPSAERLPLETTTPLLEVLDRGRIRIEREGLSAELPAELTMVALDESREGEPGSPEALRDRLAFILRLPPRWSRDPGDDWTADAVTQARKRLPETVVPDSVLRRLTLQADSGNPGLSLRTLIHSLRVARALAALTADDPLPPATLAGIAGALVLAPRGCALVPPDEPDAEGNSGAAEAAGEAPDPHPTNHPDPASVDGGDQGDRETPAPEGPGRPAPGSGEAGEGPAPDGSEGALPPVPLDPHEVVRALLPEGLLDGERTRGRAVRATPGARGSGALTRSHERGRRVGIEAGVPGRGRRLDLPATLRAAAPWQRLRGGEGLRIHRSDLRVQRRVRTAARRTIFVVDASGSQALRRLGEVKGAVELLLADAYRRREEVALVVFRDRDARTVLPPTRSLTRAKRLLRGLVGGGGTPLARGLLQAESLAVEAIRAGTQPRIFLLSDGRPNVDRSGRGGRTRARDDAMAIAAHLGTLRLAIRVLDTSARGEPFLDELARRMGTESLHLPYADARGIRAAIDEGEER